jgi:hypothetical protein
MGDPAKAKTKLGWEPKVKFDELARIMVQADFEKAKKRGFQSFPGNRYFQKIEGN